MCRLFICILFCLPLQLLAQGNSVSKGGFNSINVRLTPTETNFDEVYIGSPYLSEKFEDADISKLEKQFPVRYNVYDDRFEVKKNDSGVFAIADEMDSFQIVFVKSNRVFDKLVSSSVDKNYMERLWVGRNDDKLYKAFSVYFAPAKSANGYHSSSKAQFSNVKEDLYFYDSEKESFKEVPRGRRKRFAMMLDKKFRNYAKEKDLDIKSETDLIILLNRYYND